MARIALLAPNQAWWKASRSSRVIAGDRGRCAAVGTPVRMRAVDEPVEHGAGEIVRVVVADLEARQHLLALPLDLLGRECRMPRDVRNEIQAERRGCPSSRSPSTNEKSLPEPGAERRRQSSPSRMAICLGVLRRRALIEECRRERSHARPALRLLRGAGPDDQSQAHGRLLVVRDGDDLEPVRERSHAVRRKVHIVRGERPRRTLRGPARDLGGGATRDKPCEKQGCKRGAREIAHRPIDPRQVRHPSGESSSPGGSRR